MSTKTCPSCSIEVPIDADRCKECFHDFSEAPKKSATGPLFLLASFAAMAVVGSLVLLYIVRQPHEQRILVDEETHQIVWTTQYREGVTTETLAWDQIGKLEYEIGRTGTNRVLAVTLDGERKVVKQSTGPLKTDADRYSQLMEKPLEVVDKTRGFHTMGDEN